jgi:hypothetical protein
MTTVNHAIPETTGERYARHTRNATVFIAVIAGIIAALSIIGIIVAGIDLARVSSDLTSSSTGNSAGCQTIDSIGC